MDKLEITRKGISYVLKTCIECGDEFYLKRLHNRCSLCGGGLMRRAPQNRHLNWDELNPEAARAAHRKFCQKAGLDPKTGDFIVPRHKEEV